jgi:DNA-binding NarL/FixJ family response regulator
MRWKRYGCDTGFVMPLRCLVVDDNSSFREETRRLLEQQGIEVVGGAGSGDEALQQIAEIRPDVVLIDIDLGGESGLALARRLEVSAPQTVPRVILISLHDENDYADLIEASPAVGFVAKTELSAAAINRMLGAVDDSDPDDD